MTPGGTPNSSAIGSTVLVVIPVLNEAMHIERCLHSLLSGAPGLDEALFIVADGGSTDGSQAIVAQLQAAYPNLRMIDNPGRFQSAAVNAAVEHFADGRKILVRCDAHATYPPGYALLVARSLLDHGVEALATPMDAVGHSCFQRANAFIVDTPFGSGGSAHRGGRTSMFVDHGHHAGFLIEAFRAIGGYDPTFSHNEDAEFDLRLTRHGGRIFLDATIRISYAPRSSPQALARQYYNYGKGRARTLIKHSARPRLRQLAPPAVFAGCGAALLLSLVWPPAALLPAAYILLLAVVSVISALRMRSLCGLLAGPASGMMHMCWSAGLLRQMIARRPLRTANSAVP